MSENLFFQPKEISQILSQISKKKATASLKELFGYGILAGIYIAFGAAGATVILSSVAVDTGLARVLAGSVFSIGLMLVLIPGAELFTGNVLMTIGALNKEFTIYKMATCLSA